jgi:hypothetical protein
MEKKRMSISRERFDVSIRDAEDLLQHTADFCTVKRHTICLFGGRAPMDW